MKITDQYGVPALFRKSHGWLILSGILVCYALLILPTINRLGSGWDEAVDLVIAEAYLTPKGMLLGLSWDLSQTRLPMFTVAWIFHLFGESSLLLARLTTVLVGGLTLVGVYVYGKSSFSKAAGLLAAGLLAINPFFLSFARLAFTESDMYVACALIWTLAIMSRLERIPSLGWAALSGIFLSFAISSKATALVIVPAACISFVLSRKIYGSSVASNGSDRLDRLSALSVWLWAGAAVLIAVAGVLISRHLNAGSYPRVFHLFNYGFVWLGWLIILVWGLRNRNSTAHPVGMAAFIAGLSLLTFVIVPPEHLANSGIIRDLISRADREMAFSPAFILELAAFHTFILFLKSTPVLGLGLLAGWVISLAQWRGRPELTLPLLVSSAYLLALLSLPLGQTFYTIPLLPVLSLLAADQIVRLWSKRRTFSLALVVLGLIWWGVEIKQCYPDYHLNGYQWLGARPFFGRSSIGYRSIVYVPSDGVEQSVEWLNAHAEAGQTALLYVEPWHIVHAVAPDPAYSLANGMDASLASGPDYVVIHMGSLIRQGEGTDTPAGDIFQYPFDVDVLQNEYRKVFSVQRAFDLEMATIWMKR